MIKISDRPRIAIHKFSSCDGCQLSLLNLGPSLVDLSARVEFVHFAEMGPCNPDTEADIAIIEGSIATQADIDRIKTIRTLSKILVSVGACATSGGIQALRNSNNDLSWLGSIYPNIEHVDSLSRSLPISEYVSVDHQLWGCPINSRQIVNLLNNLLLGVRPIDEKEKLCLECKRRQIVCTLVSQGVCCMGPVTRSGCGALCPSVGRDCYGCYGAAENTNAVQLSQRFSDLIKTNTSAKSSDEEDINRAVRNRLQFIHCHNIAD